MHRLLLAATLFVSVLPSAVTAARAASYTFTTIDFPSRGAVLTVPTGINDVGQIAGFYETENTASCFLLSNGHFSSFDFTPTFHCQYLYDINNQGQVVGIATVVASAEFSGFLFDGGLSMISFPGSRYTAPFGINHAGDIVGETNVSNQIRGFLLKGGVFSLIDFPSAAITRASGINDHGQIVGTFDETHGYLLADGAFSVIDFPGALETHLGKINDAGEIVGRYLASNGLYHGFILNEQGFSTINVPGSTFTQVGGINNVGDIVGGYEDSTGSHGFFAKLVPPAFAGTPGKANCFGQIVSALAREYGGLRRAASALGFENVQALQNAIEAFCQP